MEPHRPLLPALAAFAFAFSSLHAADPLTAINQTSTGPHLPQE